jgi:hypothetical protein
MSEIISKLFGLKNAKTATIGATIIDTDLSAGYTIKGNAMSAIRSPTQVVSCPKDALNVYPSLESSEISSKNNGPVLTMAPLWVNGFIPYTRSLIDPRNASKETAAIMAKFGLVSTDMNFNSRSDEQLNTLFTFFKWYGGKDDEDRIIPRETSDDISIGKNIRMGLVCTKWSIKPLPIRYIVKQRGNDKTRDYLYLIGGSDEMLMDNPSNISKQISEIFKSILSNIDSGKNTQVGPNVTIRSITSNADLCDPNRVWWEVDDDMDGFVDHPYTKAYLSMKRLNRIIQGIIFIRNYFVYAKKHLNIENVIDFNVSKNKNGEQISIDTVISKYEDIYNYVRNIIHLYPEIASGKLSIS